MHAGIVLLASYFLAVAVILLKRRKGRIPAERPHSRRHAPTPPYPSPNIPPNDRTTLVLRGKQLTASYIAPSASFEHGSVSAGAFAALNCARIIFKKYKQGIPSSRLIDDIISEQTVQEIVSRVCPIGAEKAHFEIEEIAKLGIFSDTLKCQGVSWGKATRSGFDKMLKRLEDTQPEQPVVMIISKNCSDMIACLRLPIQKENVFVIFDPQSRPPHPRSSRLIIDTNRGRILDYLTRLMGVDEGLLNDPNRQMKIFSSFCGHCFIPRSGNPDPKSRGQPDPTMHDTDEQLKLVRDERDSLAAQLELVQEERDNLAIRLEPVEKERDSLKTQLNEFRTFMKEQLAGSRAYEREVEEVWGQVDVQRTALIHEIQRLRGQVEGSQNADRASPEQQAPKHNGAETDVRIIPAAIYDEERKQMPGYYI
ncbi:hypothetical protein BDN72DRAFT_962525 [Pluteus cervinus]|uniref:Uncharacterized protein n=1 Tax=Pluteus cervinus TaxID=181527 RepID=A0ACD3AIU1_9AGAR|nr:hypothetical protein BDN72DRAFT_962525 [Pluteus cervinus]